MAIGEAPPEIEYDELLYEEEVPKDVTLERKPFIVRDFMVGCSSGIEVVDFLEATSTPILHKIDDIILCFAVHPYKCVIICLISFLYSKAFIYGFQENRLWFRQRGPVVLLSLYKEDYVSKYHTARTEANGSSN